MFIIIMFKKYQLNRCMVYGIKCCLCYGDVRDKKNAPGMVRTSDLQVNSLALYLLSYEGLLYLL